MRTERKLEIRVGIFLTMAILLAMIAIWVLGGSQNLFKHQVSFVLAIPNAEGLMIGSRVMIAGVRAGSVNAIDLDPSIGGVKVTIRVNSSYEHALRQDSVAEILTEGVLGDRVVTITVGSPNATELKPGQQIEIRQTPSLHDVMTQGTDLLNTLNQAASDFHSILSEIRGGGKTRALIGEMTSAAKNISSASARLDQELTGIQLKSSVAQLNDILTKLNNGTGTLGALINDPVLYDDAKALVGEANQNRIVRNLVRKTIRDSQANQAGTAKPDHSGSAH